MVQVPITFNVDYLSIPQYAQVAVSTFFMKSRYIKLYTENCQITWWCLIGGAGGILSADYQEYCQITWWCLSGWAGGIIATDYQEFLKLLGGV